MTGVWQAILQNDGFLAEPDIDCKFDQQTQAATKAWQTKYLGTSQADGVVDPKTFGKASSRLSEYSRTAGWGDVGYDAEIGLALRWNFYRDRTTGRYSFHKSPGM
ncbi:peptidoglycan-binding protein [Streptomyces sp. NBC_00105]|uniref:peptidoglycan-binding domain-containing protein n=1 Tax=unclassified Streptomyces TaxID=2593676 RepID=UPI002883BE26|nr:hypothetical protein [Streptomyces sp. DSM 41633]